MLRQSLPVLEEIIMRQYSTCLPPIAAILAAFLSADASTGPPLPDRDKVIIERDIVYGDAGNRPLKLDIIRPRQPAESPLPVIAYIHGGGWRGGNKERETVRLLPFAASGNYFCVSIEYRLSHEASWPAQIHDCKAAIRWLKASAEKYDIDSDRLAAWGSSAGGHLVSLLGTTGDLAELEGCCGSPGYSTRVTCVVDFSGPSDLTAMLTSPKVTKDVKSMVTNLIGGPLDERKNEAVAGSPRTYVSAGDVPILVVQATKDPLVPFDQGELFHNALTKCGVDSTLIVIHGTDHGSSIRNPEVLKRTSAFFDRHLRGKKVEIPVEPIRGENP
jgi:acetyl esterase/lipase